MTSNNSQKTLIVGAGVIGLYLAWQLSLKGHKVSVYEKRSKEGSRLKACSTLVSERIKDSIPLPDGCIENVISGCRIHFRRKTVQLNFKPHHLVLSKPMLLDKLLELALGSGAEVFFEKDAKELPQGFDKIIGCDGALSTVRKNLGLPNPAFRLGIQFFQEAQDSSSFVETWPTRNGFCWRIPKGGETEWGILESSETALSQLKQFLKDRDVPFGGDSKFPAALVPSGLVLPKEDGEVTLCGDAAGLAKPWSGGGLVWGLKAANILLKDFPDFGAYRNETESFFYPKILKGRVSNFLVHTVGRAVPFILPGEIGYDNDFPVL